MLKILRDAAVAAGQVPWPLPGKMPPLVQGRMAFSRTRRTV